MIPAGLKALAGGVSPAAVNPVRAALTYGGLSSVGAGIKSVTRGTLELAASAVNRPLLAAQDRTAVIRGLV